MPKAHAAAATSLPATDMRSAITAFLDGNNAQALDILSRVRGSVASQADAALLRARTLLRMRDNGAALAVLTKIDEKPLSPDQRAARRMLAATASYRTGEHRQSLADLAAAFNDLGDANVHPTVAAETGYFYALALWSERRVSDAEAIAHKALAGASDIVEVRILELLGWIQITKERLAEATPYFRDGIAKFQSCTHQDVTVIAGLVHGAANIAVETLDQSMIDAVHGVYPTVRWSEADRWRHSQVAICLGRLAELDGDMLRAWNYFDNAKKLSNDGFYATFALIAQANLLSRLGEVFGSGRLLDEVGRIFDGVIWSETNAEERLALLTYAFAAATSNTAAASQALMRARSTWEKDDPLIAVSRDDRLGAYFLQASGAVRIARGERDHGLIDLRAAFDIWVRFKYDIRAATVAFLLWDVTHDVVYQQYIEDVARRIPNSWISARIGLAATSVLSKIPPAERRVLEALLAGKTQSAIAREIGKSQNTIKKQRSRLYRTLGVRNRSSFIARCIELGLSPTIAPAALRSVQTEDSERTRQIRPQSVRERAS